MNFNYADSNLDEMNAPPSSSSIPGRALQPRFQGRNYTPTPEEKPFSPINDFYAKWSKASAQILKIEIEVEREEARAHEKKLIQRKLKLRTCLRSQIFFDTLLRELRQK